MIETIAIKDFRSLSSTEIGCNWITSFVGSNDAGKSNVLRALNLFFNGETDHGTSFDFARDYNIFAVERKNKAKQVEIELTIDLPEGYRKKDRPRYVKWKKVWREEGELPRLGFMRYNNDQDFPPKSRIPSLLSRIAFSYIPAIKDQAFFGDLQGQLYDVLAAVAARPLKQSASQFEQQLQEQLRELLDSIKSGLGVAATMKLPDNLREIFENLEISSEGIPLSRRGDGIKIRHIPMMLNFINVKRDNLLNKGGVRYTHIWGFEEPENNVEMSAAFAMSEELGRIVKENDNVQMLFTTHSPIFYRMDELGERFPILVKTHFVEKAGNDTFLSEKEPDEVDETMGLMPIVAPYVRKAKERYDLMKASLDEAREILAQGQPTIFVEGATDECLLKLAWTHFAGVEPQAVRFYSGGANSYGGADAVKSRTLAWLLENKHKPSKDRQKCVALFDDDEKGCEVSDLLREDVERLNLQSIPHAIKKLKADKSLGLIRKRGYLIPIDLESLLPDEVWDEAENKGWLEKRERLQSLVSRDLLEKALSDANFSLEAGLSAAEKRRFKMKFTGPGKVAVSGFITSLAEPKQREVLSNLERTVSEILRLL